MADEVKKPKRKLVALDPEVEAMVHIDNILLKIEDPEMRRRVVTWISEKHLREAKA